MFKYADYIYTVYTEKSFTQAAKKLYISQPSLSATIKKTEELLGFTIFDRSITPLSLTSAGKMYIRAIEDVRRIERDLKNNIGEIYSLNIGSVSVGGASFISSFILPKIIMEFTKIYPGVKIDLIESNSANLQEKLISEEIEILVDYDFDSRFYSFYSLMKEHILLAVPKSFAEHYDLRGILSVKDVTDGKHLYPDIPCTDLGIFKDEPFILLKSGNNMHKTSNRICKDYGFVPKALISVDQLLTAYNISSSGMGLSFTTDTMISSSAESDNLVFCKIDSAFAERTLYIAHKKKKNMSPAVIRFVEIGRKVYKNGLCTVSGSAK